MPFFPIHLIWKEASTMNLPHPSQNSGIVVSSLLCVVLLSIITVTGCQPQILTETYPANSEIRNSLPHPEL
jgi:hypothetical protein